MTGSHGDVGALLAVWVGVPPELKADFDRWYLDEHLPEREGLPGVLSARLFEPVDGGVEHVVLYELESLEALETSEYTALRAQPNTALGEHIRAHWQDPQRRVYELRSANLKGTRRPLECPYVSAVRAGVQPGNEAPMREWLDEEHAVRQLHVEGAEAYQGFEPVDPPFYFLNLWGVQSPDVPRSSEWARVRETPWRDRLAPIRGEASSLLVRQVRR